MANIDLKPLRYIEVVVTDVLGDNFIINPFDSNGNVLSEITIVVDSTLATAIVTLPSISTLNYNWGIKINVVATKGATNDVQVYSDSTTPDTIGSMPKVQLNTDGANAECTIVSETIWSAVVTL